MIHSQQPKHNSLFSNALFIFLARFFPSLAGTLIVIFFSRDLHKEVYGAYQNFWIQLNILCPIACFGIHTVILTYSPAVLVKLKDALSFRAFIFYGIWVMVLSGFFAILQYHSLHLHFSLPYFYMFVFSLSFIVESVLIVFKNFKTLVIVNIIYSIIFLLFHLLYVYKGLQLEQLFKYLLLLCCCRFIVYFISVFFSFKKQHADTNEIALADVRKLWLHLGVYDVVQNLSNWIDKFIVTLLLGFTVSAVYFNGTQNIPFLPILLAAVGSAALIQLGAAKENDNTLHAVSLANQSGKLLSCVVFPVFYYLLFFRYELFDVLFKTKYSASIPIFTISLFIIPVRAYSFTSILQNRHKGAIINTGAIGELILACLLMYPLYKLLGLPGLALSFIISTYIQAIFYLVYTARILKINVLSLIPYYNWFIKLIVFAIIFISIHYLTGHYISQIIGLILGAVLCILCIITSLYFQQKNIRNNG